MPLCPECVFHQDYLVVAAPGFYICEAHPDYVLPAIIIDDNPRGDDGITDLEALRDELCRCVGAGPGHQSDDAFVEYPVVEYRLSILALDLYREVLVLPHATAGPVPSGKSASWYIARFGLGQLLTDGRLASTWGPGTGGFVHDTRISYWAKPGTPMDAGRLSWVEFAKRSGLDASFPYAGDALGHVR